MKNKTITTGVCELFICEMHEGSKDIEQFGISEQLKYIGAVNDVTEEKADTIVARHFMDGCRSYNIYRDYLVSANDGRWLDDSVESLHSLLTANGVVFENPLGKEPDISASAYTDMFTIAKNSRKHLRWEMEQDKVWQKKRTHIFIKQK